MSPQRRFIDGGLHDRPAKNILERIKWWVFPLTKVRVHNFIEVFPGTPEYDDAMFIEVLLTGKYPYIIKRFESFE